MSSYPHGYSSQAENFSLFCCAANGTFLPQTIYIMWILHLSANTPGTSFYANDTQLNGSPWLAIWKCILSNLASLCGILIQYNVASSHFVFLKWFAVYMAGLHWLNENHRWSAAAPDSHFSSVKVCFCDGLRSIAAIIHVPSCNAECASLPEC